MHYCYWFMTIMVCYFWNRIIIYKLSFPYWPNSVATFSILNEELLNLMKSTLSPQSKQTHRFPLKPSQSRITLQQCPDIFNSPEFLFESKFALPLTPSLKFITLWCFIWKRDIKRKCDKIKTCPRSWVE